MGFAVGCRTDFFERAACCRINAAFRLASERRIYAAAKNFVVRPATINPGEPNHTGSDPQFFPAQTPRRCGLVRRRQNCLNRRVDPFLGAAIEEAKKGLAAGGIPIGSVLVCEAKIIGRGHNQRVQRGSVIRHAEMDCLENAGRLKAAVYQRCVLYSTLSPCPMCSGAALLYKIPRIIIGENVTFKGVQVKVLQEPKCIEMMRAFITAHQGLWEEDIGV